MADYSETWFVVATLVAFAAKRQLKLLLRTLPKFLPPTDGAVRHGRLAMTRAEQLPKITTQVYKQDVNFL